jgi:hypothetical protein
MKQSSPPPLNYETPPLSGPSLLFRMPLTILFALLILPPIVFGQGCRRMLPGEKLRADELLLPAVGIPIALTLACISFPYSSVRRRVGLALIILLALLGLAGFVQDAVKYW